MTAVGTTVRPGTAGGAAAGGRTGSPLLRSMHAELLKQLRRRPILVALAVVVVVAVGGTVLGVLAAGPAPVAAEGPGPGSLITLSTLSEPGGGTDLFAQTMAFTYVAVIAVFVAAVAGEFTRGTFRTMLLHQPRRGPLLAGKVAVLLGLAWAAATVGLVVSWVAARVVAPGQGVDTSSWATAAGLSAAGQDLGRTFAFLAGAAVLATAVGVLARSVPVGVGVALVWSGPVENVVADGWSQSQDWFPGLLLRHVLLPQSAGPSTTRTVLTLLAYAVVALGVIAVALRRRDVTS